MLLKKSTSQWESVPEKQQPRSTYRELCSGLTTSRRKFEEVKKAIHAVVTLEHPDPNKLLCLFTDALRSPLVRRTHSNPAFRQRPTVRRTAPRTTLVSSWIIHWGLARAGLPLRREAFAIVSPYPRLDYMLLRPDGFLLFTDPQELNLHLQSRGL